jgi:dTDP-4-dehydrorhamnose 3,5-epimerase
VRSSEPAAGRGGGVAESGDAPELSERVRGELTFQEYGPTPRIAGVRLLSLSKHRSENGSFAELMRLDSSGRVSLEGDAFQVRQISVSHAAPGRINAFHIHPRLPQNELWSVVEGQLMVWLVDCRAGSQTEDVRQRVVLSSEEPVLLHIPAGIAHGYRAGPEGALLVYAMDQQFDPDRPNEGRLPWNHFGSELWEEDRG